MLGGLCQPLLAIPVGRGYRLGAIFVVATAAIAVILAIDLVPCRAVALPLYARQTGQPCATCHTAFLELTPFGRRFKLGGYTLGGGDWQGPPFAREPMMASSTTSTGTIRTYASRSRSTSTATLCSGGRPSTTTRPSRTSGIRFPP